MKKIKQNLKNLGVAFLFTVIILGSIYFCFNKQIKTVIGLINMITVSEKTTPKKEIIINKQNKRLDTYPDYGTVFANIKMPTVGIDIPVYHGDTEDILLKGAGHFSGSYFPGEGRFIILAGHNRENLFHNIKSLKINDEIEIDAVYGTYKYKVYDTKVINENDEESLFVEDNGEVLVLYTCDSDVFISHDTKRYVVYAKVVE